MPRIPTTTITPTTIRMTFRAPPPEAGAGAADTGGTGTAGGTEPTAGGGATGGSEEARIAAPHLVQNRVPGTMLVPQALQNAISHLIRMLFQRVGASIPQIGGEGERD